MNSDYMTASHLKRFDGNLRRLKHNSGNFASPEAKYTKANIILTKLHIVKHMIGKNTQTLRPSTIAATSAAMGKAIEIANVKQNKARIAYKAQNRAEGAQA